MAHANDGKTKLLVAAIDFGTTYSGYAFSFHSDYMHEPTKAQVPTSWVGGAGGLMSLKTPTVLLLNPDKTFNSFGYEAENKFLELVEDEEHQKYYYFRRFKMMLYEARSLKRDMMIVDANNHSMKALEVIAISINYLKNHLKKVVDNRIKSIEEDDIHWVLTVPAIWSDGSKQFMREAAELAGIKSEHLDIALEPEAASLYCMHLPVDKMHLEGNVTDTMRAAPFQKGTKYMVLDVGGGTVDITVHEVVDEGKLKELDHANGGEWGGTKVDASFEKFLSDITGPTIFKKFKSDFLDDYIDMCREFEARKRTVNSNKTGKETIKIPVNLIGVYEEDSQKKFIDRLKEMKFNEKVVFLKDKLRIDVEIVKSWFNDSCCKSVDHMKRLFRKKKNSGVNTILLVGGFSESQMLQDTFKSNFSDKRIIIPEEAGLVVLKGAVLFGHNPLTVVSRIAKCSYGIRVFRDFDSEHHPESKRVQVGKKKFKCKDIFAKHVTKGQELVIGESQSKERYAPLEADQVSLVFDVYTSSEEEPSFVTDEDCTYVGQLEVEIPENLDVKDRGVVVSMIFGGTEIRVEGKVEKTEKVTKASFDFLQ
ncbi:Heat shock 70 kDa protein 12A [Mactra antiquata]